MGLVHEQRDQAVEERLEELIRILASRAGPAGPAGPSGTIPIVANTAALTALSIVGLATGSLAVMTSVGAVWYLDTASALTTDGITIIATSGAGRWLRGPTINPEAALAQTTWQFDPQNVGGFGASDENTGLPGAPLLHKAEYFRRCGTLSPRLPAANVTYSWLSLGATAAAEQADPWLGTPICSDGFSFLLQGPALGSTGTPSGFTGSLLVVTAKSTALSGNPLESTFTTTTGAISVGMMLVNSSRSNSIAFVSANLGGGNWEIEQPFNPWGGLGNSPLTTANNTWANGDTITGYVLPAITIAEIGAQLVGGSLTASHGFVNHLAIGAASTDLCESIYGGVHLVECNVACGIAYLSGYQAATTTVFQSCHMSGTVRLHDVLINGGCVLSNFTGVETTLQGDVIVRSGNAYVSSVSETFHYGSVALGTGGVLNVFGQWSNVGAGIFYGPGTLNVIGKIIVLNGSGNLTMNCATIQLDGVTTGYSMSTSAGTTTIHGGITLNQANWAAAAGAAGFGFSATNLAGAAITTGVQP